MIKTTRSPEETKALAADLAARILKKGAASRGATIVALYGELGAGKTTFTQGFFKGLGLKKAPASPTFILMRRTSLPRKRATAVKNFKNVFHVDAYRLRAADASQLELADLFRDPQNIFLIEWPERLGKALPKRVLRIRFEHGRASEERSLRFPQ